MNLIHTQCGNFVPEDKITLVATYDADNYLITAPDGHFVVAKTHINMPKPRTTKKKVVTK